MKNDYTLYLVTDHRHGSAATLGQAVEQAIAGGCTMIQLREKNMSSRDFYLLAKEIKKITDSYDIPLIINDRLDIAMAVKAAGVHMGQSDLPARAVKEVTGRNMVLGISVTSAAEAVKAAEDGADYIGVGAIFPTGTKKDANMVSIQELQEIRRKVRLPIVVIGGINRENAVFFRDMGIDGLAVVSAILSQPDIRAAARELKDLFAT